MSSLQLQPDNTNQPIRHLPITLEPGAVRNPYLKASIEAAREPVFEADQQ